MCRLVESGQGYQVAEIKLPYIENIISQANKTAHIEKIVLFGSSLKERCSEKSDIDIAVFGDFSKGKYYSTREYRQFVDGIFDFGFEQDYDILYFKEGAKNSAPIMKDIENGVVIYRRAVA